MTRGASRTVLALTLGAALTWLTARAAIWWVIAELRNAGPDPLVLDED